MKNDDQNVGRMANPPHPGEVLWGLDMEPAGLKIVDIAKRLGVDRKTLSRVINGHAAITADMAMRLARVFNTTPHLWLNMQVNYDLWNAEQRMGKMVTKLRPLPRGDAWSGAPAY